MKPIPPLRSLIVVCALLATTALPAQVLLDDFSSFASSNTSFIGEWAANGDLISGDTTPADGFSQGAGVYNFAGTADALAGGVYRYFDAPVATGATDLLSISAQLLGANTTDRFSVTLIDGANNTAVALFSSGDFVTGASRTVSATWTSSDGFDATNVAGYFLAGYEAADGLVLGVQLDTLAAGSLSAVPEPSTYATFAGLAAGIAAAWRRRGRRV